MCAFGRVKLHRAELTPAAPDLKSGPIGLTTTVHVAALLAPEVHRHALAAPAVTGRAADLKVGTGIASKRLAPGAFEMTSHVLGRVQFRAVVHETPALALPRVHKNLDAARNQPVRRRSVPLRLLSAAQVTHWQETLGASKRVAPKHVAIVALFPNVALGANQPVQFLPEEAALAYHLPPKPQPLSTVVVAKHAVTGELLLGRFAQD